MASTRQFELNEPEGQNGSPRLGGATGHPAQPDGELNPLRVAVVAGVRLVREGLSRILGGEPGIALVEPASLLRASSAEAEVHPHVVIADSALVRTTDLVARAAAAGATVVAFGVAEDDEEEVLACAEAGVVGIVERDATVQDLVETLQTSVTGNARCSPRVTALVLRRVAKLASLPQEDGTSPSLTRREWEIAALIERGLSNKEIAAQLGIETATVKNHVHSLLEKLRVKRRGEVPAALRNRRSHSLLGSGASASAARLSQALLRGQPGDRDPLFRDDPDHSNQSIASGGPNPR